MVYKVLALTPLSRHSCHTVPSLNMEFIHDLISFMGLFSLDIEEDIPDDARDGSSDGTTNCVVLWRSLPPLVSQICGYFQTSLTHLLKMTLVYVIQRYAPYQLLPSLDEGEQSINTQVHLIIYGHCITCSLCQLLWAWEYALSFNWLATSAARIQKSKLATKELIRALYSPTCW